MLVFSVLLLATSAFAAPSVLVGQQHQGNLPSLQQSQFDYNQNKDYVNQGPGQTLQQSQFDHNQNKDYVNQGPGSVAVNPFLNQQDLANEPAVGFMQALFQQQVHNVVPNSPVGQVPVQGVFGRSNNQQYNVVPKSNVFQQGFVQPQQQQVGVVPSIQGALQPRHHVAGHEGFVEAVKERVSNDPSANAKILQQEIDVSPDGSFHNVWNSDNGINVNEQGNLKHVGDTDVAVQQGVVAYVDNEGNNFELRYVADETGFHVEGPHIPTPPPIPAAIARALQFIADHPSTEAPTAQDQTYQQGPAQQQSVIVDN